MAHSACGLEVMPKCNILRLSCEIATNTYIYFNHILCDSIVTNVIAEFFKLALYLLSSPG